MDSGTTTDVFDEIFKAIDEENFASARFTISSAIDKACGTGTILKTRPAHRPKPQQPNLLEQSL